MPSLVELGQVILEIEEDFFKFCYFAILLLSPLKKVWPFIWTKLKGLVETGPVVLEKIFFVNIFFTPLLISPLGKEHGPSYEETFIPFTQGCFVPSLVEIGPVVLEKKKMWKVYNINDEDYEVHTNKEQWTNRDQKSSPEP